MRYAAVTEAEAVIDEVSPIVPGLPRRTWSGSMW